MADLIDGGRKRVRNAEEEEEEEEDEGRLGTLVPFTYDVRTEGRESKMTQLCNFSA